MHKYGKFTDQEITVLNDKNDLVAKVQPKYPLDRPQAQSTVDAFAKGRQLVMRKWSPSAIGGAIDGLEVSACLALICAFFVHRDSIGGHRDACYVDFLL
jgi:hypothetical protein